MKKNFNLLLFIVLSLLLFVSCNQDDPDPIEVEPDVSYIINYGSYTGDKTTITAYDKETGTATNNYYTSVNGVSLVSNVQHATSFNNKIYFMGNSSDQIFWVDGETFEQTENAITEDIIKPRFG